MPAPKDLSAYPDEFFDLLRIFGERPDHPPITVTCSSTGLATYYRQLFYTFRLKALRELPPELAPKPGAKLIKVQLDGRRCTFATTPFATDALAQVRAQETGIRPPQVPTAQRQAPDVPSDVPSIAPRQPAQLLQQLQSEATATKNNFEDALFDMGFRAAPLAPDEQDGGAGET